MSSSTSLPEFRLEEFSSAWADAYAEERDRISSVLADQILGIEHIGSTAIPGLCAMPAIDIAIAVHSLSAVEGRGPLMSLGYEYAGEGVVPGSRLYVRRAENLTQLVHAVVADSQEWQDFVNFRDTLRANAEALKRYDSLKRALAHKFAEHRPSYAYAKGRFIESVLR